MATNNANVMKQVAELQKKLKELTDTVAPVKDELQGEVGEDEESTETTEEGMVLEKSDSGHGFQVYRDYSKSPHLSRLHV